MDSKFSASFISLFPPLTLPMTIGLKVKAGAKVNSIGDFIMVDGIKYLKISIKSQPEHGKANREIISFLSSSFKIPKRAFKIIKGNSSSLKILSIANPNHVL